MALDAQDLITKLMYTKNMICCQLYSTNEIGVRLKKPFIVNILQLFLFCLVVIILLVLLAWVYIFKDSGMGGGVES